MNATETTTVTITWGEENGMGRITARSEEGEYCGSARWEEPITAATDSHAVANAIFGKHKIVSVEHDREFVHVTLAD